MGGMNDALDPRALAWAALGDVLDKRLTADAATAHWPEQPFARAMLLATLRHAGQIDALLAGLLEKPVPKRHAAVMHALRLGVAQLLVLEVPAHAAVHETVAMVKASRHAPLAGLVNAVLKQVQAPLPDYRHNLPAWLEQRWKAQYGKAVTDAICAVANQPAPLDLNTQQAFEAGARLDAQIWRMGVEHPPVPSLPGYDAGEFFVQDVAASYPVRLLGDLTGLQALDIGAAPGGKTAQLAQAGAQVVALDKSAVRMDRLCQNMRRLGQQVDLQVGDALQYEPRGPFDVVVLDAPCSATGTWRRHPEVVQITTLDDIHELAETQRALLARAWGWVKPGGRLLYCVCSLEREEGEDQRDWFLRTHRDARAEGEALRTTPAMLAEQGGMDGFFACVFTKISL